MMDRDFQALLDCSQLLAELGPLSRAALRLFLSAARFAPGEVLLAAGDIGDRVFILLTGAVQIRLPVAEGGHLVARLGPDHLLGEVAFFGQVPQRTADVVADGEVVAAVLTRETYRQMVATNPGAAEALEKLALDVMLAKVGATEARMIEVFGAHSGDAIFQAEARMLAGQVHP